MGPTRRPSSGGGLRSVHASMSTTRPPTGPGSTWSSGGLPNSPTSKSAAGFTAVSANWRPPSANSSPPTTKPPSLSFGPKPPTKSSPASLATRNALSPPNPGNLSHEPLGQETRWRRLGCARFPVESKGFLYSSSATERQLLSISPRQIDRRLRAKKTQRKRRIYGRTKPGHLLKHHIPVKTYSWEVTSPGFTEVDLVSHSGNSGAGEFAHTLNVTDIHTTWTESRA